MSSQSATSWQVAQVSHRAALSAFLSLARALSGEEWDAPVAPGKWSAAQITEHLRRTYDVLRTELEGGRGVKLRSAAWLRPWLRLRYLGAILRTGRVPKGARAPREVRPGDGPFPQIPTVAALEASANAFEVALGGRWTQPGSAVTHPLFGGLSAGKAFRFVTVHTEHHRRQLPKAMLQPPN